MCLLGDLLDDVEAFGHLAEASVVVAVQMGRVLTAVHDEELEGPPCCGRRGPCLAPLVVLVVPVQLAVDGGLAAIV